MTKQIIALTGELSSGKTTAANYLANKFDGKIYGFSGPLRDILTRLHLPLDRANLVNLSEIIRNQFGSDLISRTIAHDISDDLSDFIILEGVRREPDIAMMKDLPGFRLIAITADNKLRWERITKRGQNVDDHSKTYEQFLLDEQSESDRDIPEVMKSAEVIISNNDSIEEFYEQLDKLFS